MRVLVVEDERKTLAYLQKGLTESGFVVDVASRGDEGLELALERDYDFVILDVMLPERNGWAVLAEIRRAGKQTPVLFLTARDAVRDRVKGLELGAEGRSAAWVNHWSLNDPSMNRDYESRAQKTNDIRHAAALRGMQTDRSGAPSKLCLKRTEDDGGKDN